MYLLIISCITFSIIILYIFLQKNTFSKRKSLQLTTVEQEPSINETSQKSEDEIISIQTNMKPTKSNIHDKTCVKYVENNDLLLKTKKEIQEELDKKNKIIESLKSENATLQNQVNSQNAFSKEIMEIVSESKIALESLNKEQDVYSKNLKEVFSASKKILGDLTAKQKEHSEELIKALSEYKKILEYLTTDLLQKNHDLKKYISQEQKSTISKFMKKTTR